MKRFLLFQLAMATVLLSLLSCQKEDVEPEPEPEPEPEEIVFPCEHMDVEYVAPVRRTETTPGNIGHYHCNECNRNFLDADATREVNSPYLPALNLSLDTNILNQIKDILPFVPSSEESKSVANDIGILFDKVIDFNHKITVQSQLKELVGALKEIKRCLESINTQLTAIEAQNKTIIKMLQGQTYASKIEDLLSKEMFVYKHSVDWIGYVKDEYEKYDSGVTTEEEFLNYLNQIGYSWAQAQYNGNSNIYPLTQQLIDDFDGIATAEKVMTYPQIFHKFNDIFRIWDNEGYTDRKQLDLQAKAALSAAYFMSCIYFYHTLNDPKGYAPARDDQANKYKDNFAQIKKLVDEDINQMDLAYKNYRRFHDGNTVIYLKNSSPFVNPDRIDGHYNEYKFTFQHENKDGKFWQGIDQIHKCWEAVYNNQIGYNDGTALTAEDYSKIRNTYTNGDIYQILACNAKISGVPSRYKDNYNMDGHPRQVLIKYHSPNYKKSDNKTERYYGGFLYGHGYYDEYYVKNHGAQSNISGCCYLYCNGMTASCCRDGAFTDLLYCYYSKYYSDVSSSFQLTARCRSGYDASKYYTPFVYACARYYKGTIYDQL